MEHTSKNSAWKLAAMTGISFISMYILMYLMVDKFSDVYLNLDQTYMVIAMTAAMVLIELSVMKSMYEKGLRRTATIVSGLALITSVLFIRNQTGISDKEFLKSMISHHGSALLMCEKVDLRDSQIKKLCSDIISSQQSQIDWMKSKLLNLKY